MGYELACDSCEFTETVKEEWKSYGTARDHEIDHPAHAVIIHSVE